jgi:hypothetical protein
VRLPLGRTRCPRTARHTAQAQRRATSAINRMMRSTLPPHASPTGLLGNVAHEPRIPIGRVGLGFAARCWCSAPSAKSRADCRGERLAVRERLLPDIVVMDGDVITPDCGLLADVMSPQERPRGLTRSLHLSDGTMKVAAQ